MRAAGLAVKVLVVDNYDSFTYNLVQYLGELGRRARGRAQRPRRRSTSCSRAAPTASSSRPGRARPTRPASRSRPCAASPRPASRRWASASATSRSPRRSAAGDPPRAGARQDDDDRARRPHDLRRPAAPLTVGRYHSLVVDDDAARQLRGHRHRRRRPDGHPPPRAARRGRPVPPRVGPDRRRASAARRTSSAEVPQPDVLTARDRRARLRPRPVARAGRRGAARDHGRRRARGRRSPAFLIALRTKGETGRGARRPGARRCARSRRRSPSSRDDLLDTAGTGGGAPTFNVSTTAALIAAGAGCAVAKHGNRSATGLSGSADVLEALGARIDLAPDGGRALHRRGRLRLHVRARPPPATRYVVPVRKELAVRTIFNFLGPLTNPAGARRQLIGVSDPAFLDVMAGALARLGRRPGVASVQRGWARRDEHVRRHPRRRGQRRRACERYTVDARGRRARAARRRGRRAAGRREDNAATTRAILAGEPGPRARPRACSTPAPRSTPRGRGRLDRRRASTPPSAAIDSGARRASALDGYVDADRRARRPA